MQPSVNIFTAYEKVDAPEPPTEGQVPVSVVDDLACLVLGLEELGRQG